MARPIISVDLYFRAFQHVKYIFIDDIGNSVREHIVNNYIHAHYMHSKYFRNGRRLILHGSASVFDNNKLNPCGYEFMVANNAQQLAECNLHSIRYHACPMLSQEFPQHYLSSKSDTICKLISGRANSPRCQFDIDDTYVLVQNIARMFYRDEIINDSVHVYL